MTTYNYLTQMQEFCFRAAMALSALDDIGTRDFYLAADRGFYDRLEKITREEAEAAITQSQIEQYLRTQNFVNQKEKEAAEKLHIENQHKPKISAEDEAAYDEVMKQLNDNQEYDDKLQAKIEAMHD